MLEHLADYPVQPLYVLSTQKYYVKKVRQFPVTARFARFTCDQDVQTPIFLPHGGHDIVFEFSANDCNAFIHGMLEDAYTNISACKKGMTYLVITLKPGFSEGFGGAAVRELNDRQLPLDSVFPTWRLLAEEVAAQPDFEAQISTLMKKFVLPMIRPELGNKNKLLWNIMEENRFSGGQMRLSELEQWTGYSRQYLLRTFKTYTGVGIKSYSLHTRFQESLSMISSNLYGDMSRIAVECGFFDQSHFTKAFKKFADFSPTDYAAIMRTADYERRISRM